MYTEYENIQNRTFITIFGNQDEFLLMFHFFSYVYENINFHKHFLFNDNK